MIFWEHIKGLNQLDINQAWTYINFCNSVEDNTSTDQEMSMNPTIGFSASGCNINKNYILTSNMTNGSIANSFNFLSTLNIADTLTVGSDESVIHSYFHGDAYFFKRTYSGGMVGSGGIALPGKGSSTTNRVVTNALWVWYGDSSNPEDKDIAELNIGWGTPATGDQNYSCIWLNHPTHIRGDCYIENGKCEALYFNATSDYRAKKDFKPLQIDALKLIKSIQPYTFKYKDSNLPSIGIIAQDVQDIDLEGFKLVDNENATGENMDYMTIHESKLIYILWKAIQEQQKEIENLKKLLQ